jgi:hypothetical protein
MKVKLELEREEALVCIIALENKRHPYEWQKSALSKLLKAMGLEPVRRS